MDTSGDFGPEVDIGELLALFHLCSSAPLYSTTSCFRPPLVGCHAPWTQPGSASQSQQPPGLLLLRRSQRGLLLLRRSQQGRLLLQRSLHGLPLLPPQP